MNGASITVIGSYIADIKSTTPGCAGHRRVERAGAVSRREQLSGSLRRELHARRRHARRSRAWCRRTWCSDGITSPRPAAWRSENWVVKNLFELKNARRVLVEGNLFENNWVDGQPGYAIVFTPRGEGGAAPWATVEDVTFRYNIVRNSSAAFNLLARDSNGASGTMRRVRIADNLIYGIDRAEWGGNGTFMQIGEGPSEVTVEHNTIIHTGKCAERLRRIAGCAERGGALRLPQQHQSAQPERRHRPGTRRRQRLDRRVLSGRACSSATCSPAAGPRVIRVTTCSPKWTASRSSSSTTPATTTVSGATANSAAPPPTAPISA